jgi:hypothetical protein
MARIDDLPADQQAVLRLLLTQNRSYEEIARSLRMAPAAVRDRAHEALATLGPAGGQVPAERRAQITDYLLGQQDEGEAIETRAALERSAAERGWARVVSSELHGLAEHDLPEVPGPSANGAAALLTDEQDESLPTGAATRAAARATAQPSSRRGGAILLGVLGILATLAIGFFVGRATKSDDRGGSAPATSAAQRAAAANVIGQANLTAVPGSGAGKAIGVAQFVENDARRVINVLAQNLPTAPKGSGYGVWLTGSGQAPLWLGYFQAVTTTGQVGAQSALKRDPRIYSTVLITRESGRRPKTPGTASLTGPIRFRTKR